MKSRILNKREVGKFIYFRSRDAFPYYIWKVSKDGKLCWVYESFSKQWTSSSKDLNYFLEREWFIKIKEWEAKKLHPTAFL